MRFSSSGVRLHLAERRVGFERGFHALQDLELVVEVGVLDLLAVPVEAFQALLDHHQVAEDQLGLDIVEVAQRVDRALLVRHGVALEDAEHVGQGVHHAQAAQVARLAQSFLGDGREVEVLDGGVRDASRAGRPRPGVQRAGPAPWRRPRAPPCSPRASVRERR